MARIAQWSLNEASGTRVDPIGGYNLTPIGSVAAVPGLFGNAVNVPASSRLDAGDIAGLEFATAPYTFSAWIKTTSSDNQVFLCKWLWSTSNREYLFRVNNGNLEAYISSNGITQEELIGSNISGLNDGAWHFVVWTRSGTVHKFYVDGAWAYTATATIPVLHTGPATFSIGAYPDNALPWADGAIDNIEIWDEALSDAAVSATYYASTLTMSLTALSPGSGTTGIDVDTAVAGTIQDTVNTVQLSSVIITIGGTVAWSGGSLQNGFTGTVVQHGQNVDYSLTPPSDFVYGTAIPVLVYAQSDGPETLDTNYQFTTEVLVTVDGLSPDDGDTDVDVDSHIIFHLTDGTYAPDLASTGVTVEGVTAYSGGSWQNSFTGTIAGGTFDIVPPADFDNIDTINVAVTGLDTDFNPFTRSWSFTTAYGSLFWGVDYVEVTELPYLTNLDPAPDSTEHPITDHVYFEIKSPTCDIFKAPLVITMDLGAGLIQAYIHQNFINDFNGTVIEALDDGNKYYRVSIYPPNGVFPTLRNIVVGVVAENVAAGLLSTSYGFETGDEVVEQETRSATIRAVSGDQNVSVSWSVSQPDDEWWQLFQLVRSQTQIPTTPSQGEVVYVGSLFGYSDDDVVNNTTYYYTIFVLKHDSEYVPYDDDASDSARPRSVSALIVSRPEYVPARGDFGKKTCHPLPQSVVTEIWGQNGRTHDLIRTQANKPFLSPVNGNIRSISSLANQGQDQRPVRIEIETPSQIVLSISGVISSVSRGQAVGAKQILGRTIQGPVEFEVYRLPTEDHGRRTIRPRYFYLTVEEREGR